ncbi:MAG TPA: c-type cytochrome [Acidimicrobiia bacterium]|nr:c-type cytochrome [Acidimicrobiia bacterium]
MKLHTILFWVNGIALVVFAVLAVVGTRKRKPADPPNLTPYYDDETMEGPKLERFLGAAVIFSAILAAALPTYWLLEPSRQTKMNKDFLSASIERGRLRFAVAGTVPPSEVLNLECARCHGAKAEGGAATFLLQPSQPGELPKTVSWTAPSLNDVLLRFSPDEVTQIITYGRPGTPMPAWGLAGGGPLPDQPISDLVNFLQSIQLTPEEAMKRNTDRAAQIMKDNPGISEGQALFMANCARCHTKGYSYGEPQIMGGGGAFGPNLTNGVTLRQFPPLAGGVAKHVEFVTTGSDFQKPYGTQGIGSGRMPGFGQELSAKQIDEIVIYERSL